MPQQPPIQPRNAAADARVFAELIEGFARSVCLTIQVFLHSGFGARYVGCGFIGVLAILGFTLCFPAQEGFPLVCFAALYGGVWLVVAVSVLIRGWRSKQRVHSLYTGRPFLCRWLPNWLEVRVKYLEAGLVILLGCGVHHFSRPLGDYLMLAAALVLARAYNLAAQQRDRAVEMNDSIIGQEQVAERFRDMQRDGIS